MIAAALIVFAAICKAIADTIAHHKDSSIFKRSKFWSQNGKFLPLTKYKADGWHFSNSTMIICFILAAVLHEPVIAWYWELLAGGVLFNLVFNILYNKVFR